MGGLLGTEPGMMNIYWTKTKLRSVAKPSNLSSDFPLGSRKFIFELVYVVINFTTRPM